jgi:hypothetical protein
LLKIVLNVSVEGNGWFVNLTFPARFSRKTHPEWFDGESWVLAVGNLSID